MRIIGITGGVGAGKSLVLEYLSQKYGAYVIYADRVANDLKLPGEKCYDAMVQLMGEEILSEDGTIDKAKMAARIFEDKQLLTRINGIIHPAVKTYILQEIENKRREGQVKLFVIEAALLIEDHYDEICDELWYIYADRAVRQRRLMESRGYSKQRIDNIMNGQLADEEYRKHCRIVIDNGHDVADTYLQIDKKLEAYQCQA
ncbi:MAG: dephospho-CoA kinase [Lachnospiraceae bacterium]|nr:dephospho-CoA kinase [Lachnospiraceae bacterium]